jgi:hypothetical protein
MTHLKLAFGAVAASLLLAGCASSSKPFWHKPGASADDAYTALSECKFQVGLSKIPKSERDDLVAHCMRGKGYRLLANPD